MIICEFVGFQLLDNQILEIKSTKGDWSSGMIPVLGTGGPGFNSRIAPFWIQSNYNTFYYKLYIHI